MGLTNKQRAFVEAFRGNATEAARAAGYAGDANALAVAGHRLLKNAKIQRALRARQARVEDAAREGTSEAGEATADPTILDLAAEQRALTEIVRDPSATHRDRIRAIEVLARMQGHFVPTTDALGEDEGAVQIVVWRGNGRGPAPQQVDVAKMRREALESIAADPDAPAADRARARRQLRQSNDEEGSC